MLAFINIIRRALNSKDENERIINSLLKRDVEYMELKSKVVEQQKLINQLEEQIKANNKIIRNNIDNSKVN